MRVAPLKREPWRTLAFMAVFALGMLAAIAVFQASQPRAYTLRGSPTAFLWVNRDAYDLWTAAFMERDQRRMSTIMSTYDHFQADGGTQVKVLNVDARVGAAQVEMSTGQHIGRRGWIEREFVNGL